MLQQVDADQTLVVLFGTLINNNAPNFRKASDFVCKMLNPLDIRTSSPQGVSNMEHFRKGYALQDCCALWE